MRVFVTGITGQLGHDVMIELARKGHEAIGTARSVPNDLQSAELFVKLDLTDEKAVTEAVESIRPDAVIHCAAWTAVDAAEDEENRDAVYAANVLATRYLAEAAKTVDAKMLYLSTDYVFDGLGTRPWEPDDRCFHPLNYYGQTKLEGEKELSSILEKHFIVRIAWVFGLNGKNFIRTMINVGKTHDTVRVVDDQIGTPTYTKDLAGLLVDMAETERYGFSMRQIPRRNPADISVGRIWRKRRTGRLIAGGRAAGMKTKVVRVSTEEYGLTKAVRPFNSRLDKSKLVKEGFRPLPDWKNAISRYLSEIGE